MVLGIHHAVAFLVDIKWDIALAGHDVLHSMLDAIVAF
jgi:hypothetical protein